MNTQFLKRLTGASVAALALSFTPFALGQYQSTGPGHNSTTNQNNQSTTQNSAATSNPESASDSSSSSLSSSGTSANAQFTMPQSDTGSAGMLRLASQDESKRTVEKMTGKKLRGNDSQDLGTVKDFLVDPQSGQVRFAVVSVGGFMGVGDKLHLVSFASLQQDPSGRDFSTSLTKDQLTQAPLVNEEQFEENRISPQSSAMQSSNSSAVASDANASGSAPLLRATKIKGRNVAANGDRIGSIEGIVIEPGQNTAMALLDPNRDVAGSGQKFLVPLNRFTITGDKDITTTLTRADFQSAVQANTTASNDSSVNAPNNLSTRQSQNVAADASSGTAAPMASIGASKNDISSDAGANMASNHTAPANSANGPRIEFTNNAKTSSPSETGLSSADQNPSTSSMLISGARAIRQALDQNADTARAPVVIRPENGKITLTGTLDSSALKSQIEQTANRAAPDCPIVSELKTQNTR